MKYFIEQISPETWAKVSEGVHHEVFKTYKPKEWDRIDYALLILRDGDKDPIAYMTCREISNDAVYWQYGGSFDEIRGTTASWVCYKEFVAWARQRYKCVQTYTANTNATYLKMALKAGFKIIGTRNFKGEVFVDLLLEFEEEK